MPLSNMVSGDSSAGSTAEWSILFIDRLEMGWWITASVLLLLGAVIWLRPRLTGRA